jgi:hypothetical protein
MISEEELKAIEERRASAVDHLKPYEGIVFAATNENAVTITLSRSSADVDALIAEVRRLKQESASTLTMYQIASKGLADMEAVARRLQAENQELRAIRDTQSTSSRRT